MEFTEEQTAPEEVQVDLGAAERKEAEPSLVGTQEQVVEPQAAEHLETEDVSDMYIFNPLAFPFSIHNTLLYGQN